MRLGGGRQVREGEAEPELRPSLALAHLAAADTIAICSGDSCGQAMEEAEPEFKMVECHSGYYFPPPFLKTR